MNYVTNELTDIKEITTMYNPVLRWTKSPSPNVQQYVVSWTLNGTVINSLTIGQTPASDSAGYITSFSAANPTLVLKSGDVVSATVVAVDTVDTLTSTVMIPNPTNITIPASPPLPPINGTLSLS